MSNYNSLKATINANVKQNGNQEITGQVLNGVLNAMVNSLGAGYQYIGIATPTSPGSDQTPDYKCFYLALTPGTYSHLGGLVVNEGEVCILKFDTSWTKDVTGIATAASVQAKQDIITDLATIRSGAASGATAVQPAALAAYFLISNIVSQLGESADKVISQAGITAILADYAKINGIYDYMIVGAAKNLVGYGAVPASFLFRTAGGDQDLGTGTAQITELKGNGMVWNQLVGSDTSSVTVPSGHKYISIIDGSFSLATSTGAALSVTGGSDCVFDLTIMFGAGNEPTTVADFRSIFPLDYYAFNAGEVLPFCAENLVTTGFNQWDEVWEAGGYNLTDGATNSGANRIRSKNLIPVFAGTKYYINSPLKTDNSKSALWCLFYDASETIIPTPSVSEKLDTSANGVLLRGEFTVPAGAAYMKFMTQTFYGDTYASDICINLSWSGYRNGEYEPYEKHTLALDPKKIYGKLNGDGDYVQIFPNGMYKAVNALDYASLLKNECDVKLGSIDMGNMTWGKTTIGGRDIFFGNNPGTSIPASNVVANILCAKYVAKSWATMDDKSMSVFGGTSSTTPINVMDSAYSDAATFKTAMSGVELVYELASPLHYTDCVYRDNGVDTPLANKANYYVNDFGTEEWQPANTADPYTAPCNLEIAYAMDAVDTLRRLGVNYIKKQSMDNILTAFKTAGIISAYSLTYNSETDEYDCSVTA